MGTYRPVSILPIISKVLEKVILTRFVEFERKYNLLSKSQFGFRKGLGTELALLAQKELILDSLEGGKLVLGIFVDFTKAFDYINNDILRTKLEHYGFRGKAACLIQSYLQYRKQIGNIEDSFSDPLRTSYGVPQGRIPGSFLFNMSINDLATIAPVAKFFIYADDTSIFFVGELVNDANNMLQRLGLWAQHNGLKINRTKTKP